MASTTSEQVHPSSTRTFEPEAASVARARQFVSGVLDGPQPLVEDVCLVVSELATNAVLHARTPYEVALVVAPEAVRVEVRDGSPRQPVSSRAEPEIATGRGLAIVDALSVAWGVQPDSQGKVVWAELSRPR
jgi:anti-sigma regulatory factor (Ser/Thr protein kinase)